MKKIILLLAFASVAFFAACDDKEPQEEPKPFPIGTWQTNHEHFSRTVDETNYEYLRERLATEVSGSVTKEESYRLTFNEDGTGYGSGAYPDGSGRYQFDFTWKLSDNPQAVETTKSGDGDLFFYNYVSWGDVHPMDLISGDFDIEESTGSWKGIDWTLENYSDDHMILSFSFESSTVITEGILDLKMTYTYRYSFERVK